MKFPNVRTIAVIGAALAMLAAAFAGATTILNVTAENETYIEGCWESTFPFPAGICNNADHSDVLNNTNFAAEVQTFTGYYAHTKGGGPFCIGTPDACSTWNNKTAECSTMLGCSVGPSFCGGTASACSTWNGNPLLCGSQQGCSYNYILRTCTGTHNPCLVYNSSFCPSQIACSWNDYCSGTHAACNLTNYPDSASCTGNTTCMFGLADDPEATHFKQFRTVTKCAFENAVPVGSLVYSANETHFLERYVPSGDVYNQTRRMCYLNESFVWSEVTWNNRSSSAAWTAKGGSCGMDVATTVTVLSQIPNGTTNTWYSFNLSNTTVSLWVNDSSANNGTLMFGNETTNQSYGGYTESRKPEWASGEAVSVSTHPYCTILFEKPPWFTLAGVNNSNPAPDGATAVKHFATWYDDTGLDDFSFGWNATGSPCGTWKNSTWAGFGAANGSNSTNASVIPSNCEGLNISWRFHANDTAGVRNTSAQLRNYTVANVNPVVTNVSVNTTSAYQNETVCVNATVTDVGIGVNSSTVHMNFVFPNGTVYGGYSLTNSSSKGTCGGGGSIYSAFLNVGGTASPPNLTVQAWKAQDLVGNEGTNSTEKNVTVLSLNSAPVYNGSNVTPVSGSNYSLGLNVTLNVSWLDDGAGAGGVNYSFVTFDGVNYTTTLISGSNASGVYQASFVNLAAGNHVYNFSACDGNGACNYSPVNFVYQIVPTDPLCRLYLNSTAGNVTYNVSVSSGNQIHVGAAENATDATSTLELFENETLVVFGHNILFWNHIVSTADNGSVFNYTERYNATENYSACSATWFATVVWVNEPPVYINHNVTPVNTSNWTAFQNISFCVNWTDDFGVNSSFLSLGGSNRTMNRTSGVNGTTNETFCVNVTGLSASTWAYSFNANDASGARGYSPVFFFRFKPRRP